MPRKTSRAVIKESSSDLSPPPEPSAAVDDGSTSTPRATKRKRGNQATPVKQEVKGTATTGPATKSSKRTRIETPNGAIKQEEESVVSTPRSSRKRKAVTYTDPAEDEGAIDTTTVQPTKARKQSKKVKTEQVEEVTATTDPVANGEATVEVKKTVRKRKTKEEKEAEAMPLAPRTIGHAFNIGAHVSASGGVHNALTNAAHIGANAFALFLKSQRKWANPPLADDVAAAWHEKCAGLSYEKKLVVPHGSYLVNLAHTDKERTEQAYTAFVDDLKRCERLGIGLYNFHPGNVQGVTRAEAIRHLAGNLNRAHKETGDVVTLLENMAAGGNVLGSTFEDLAEVIEQVDDKDRVGVCLDTCHAFAAGYDLRDKAALDNTLGKLDEVVGLKYLRALHLNDSKAPFQSHRDLHANIGTGFLGLRAFHAIMNEPRLHGLPLVLETPIDVYDGEGNPVKDEKGKENKEDKNIWATEIKMLERLAGMDTGSAEFKDLELALAAKGQKERARVQDQVDRRDEKAKTKATKSPKGRKKKVAETDSIDGESD